MFPYLDASGFIARSIINAADLATFEATASGFIEQRIASWSSWLNAQARKRYGNNPYVGQAVPFGQTPAPVLAAGTLPPPVALTGRPVLGSIALDLAITTPGPLGAALFQWSTNGGQSWAISPAPVATGSSPPAAAFVGLSELDSPSDVVVLVTLGGGLGVSQLQYSGDGGNTWTIAPAPVTVGTTPQAVTLTGFSTLATPGDLVVEITSTGPQGSAVFQWSLNGGVTWNTGVRTAPAVPLAGTGLTVNFPGGQYTTGDTYTAQGLPTASLISLAPFGLTLEMPTGPYTVGDRYVGQGLATASSVPLAGTGLAASFAAGAYGLDNVYTAATPVPEIILGWLTALLNVDVMRKRGVNPQDPMLELMVEEVKQVRLEVQEAVNGKDGLWDIPTNEDGDSAVTTGGPMCYSESSPYVSADAQEREGICEDLRGCGTRTER